MSYMTALAKVSMGIALAKGQMPDMPDMGAAMPGLSEMFGGKSTPLADQMTRMTAQMGEMMKPWTEANAMPGLSQMTDPLRSLIQTGNAQMAQMMQRAIAGTPVETLLEAQSKLMLRAMLQAAQIGGGLSAADKSTILAQLDSDTDPQTKSFVKQQLDAPLGIQALANEAGEQMREQIYVTTLATLRSGTEAESAYLKQLAQALSLDEATCARLREQVGSSAA